MRILLLIVVAVLAVALPAAAVLTGWTDRAWLAVRDLAKPSPTRIAPPVPGATRGTDFSWIQKAMSDCESLAAADPASAYFLVIPLAATKPGDPQWSAGSLDRTGNTLLLVSRDALNGLREGNLQLYGPTFSFNVLNQSSNAVTRWKSSSGVSRFSIPDASAMAAFKLRIDAGTGAEANWSNSFNRAKGSCHWISALISH